ncbi:MAG: hypothetical protein Q9P14_17520 [candidate division KSB1 bacterium]|nr:hypothetical protein [candidate division KSB1 bacterium]
MQKATVKQVKSAALVGFTATFLFYWLEKQALLQRWEPAWLAETGLGYILWAFIASGLTFVLAGIDKSSAADR